MEQATIPNLLVKRDYLELEKRANEHNYSIRINLPENFNEMKRKNCLRNRINSPNNSGMLCFLFQKYRN